MRRRRIFSGKGPFRAGIYELLRAIDWRTVLAVIALGGGGYLTTTLIPALAASSGFWSVVAAAALPMVRLAIEWAKDNTGRQVED